MILYHRYYGESSFLSNLVMLNSYNFSKLFNLVFNYLINPAVFHALFNILSGIPFSHI